MIVKNSFGTTADGSAVDCYTIRNSSETAVDIITYGATVNSIYVATLAVVEYRQGKICSVE